MHTIKIQLQQDKITGQEPQHLRVAIALSNFVSRETSIL